LRIYLIKQLHTEQYRTLSAKTIFWSVLNTVVFGKVLTTAAV